MQHPPRHRAQGSLRRAVHWSLSLPVLLLPILSRFGCDLSRPVGEDSAYREGHPAQLTPAEGAFVRRGGRRQRQERHGGGNRVLHVFCQRRGKRAGDFLGATFPFPFGVEHIRTPVAMLLFYLRWATPGPICRRGACARVWYVAALSIVSGIHKMLVLRGRPRASGDPILQPTDCYWYALVFN